MNTCMEQRNDRLMLGRVGGLSPAACAMPIAETAGDKPPTLPLHGRIRCPCTAYRGIAETNEREEKSERRKQKTGSEFMSHPTGDLRAALEPAKARSTVVSRRPEDDRSERISNVADQAPCMEVIARRLNVIG